MVWDKPQDEGLTEMDRQLIGGHKRVKIPLDNKTLLRDVADILRGLAQQMDVQSRLDNTSERDALLRIGHEIDHANRLIRSACDRYDVKLRDGRPPDSERLGKVGRNGNAERTWETVSFSKPPYLDKRKLS